jgi:hypothetical protein
VSINGDRGIRAGMVMRGYEDSGIRGGMVMRRWGIGG